jgi:hypothetical protein
VDVAAARAVVPAYMPVDDSVPARVVGERPAVVLLRSWKRAPVASDRPAKADVALRAPADALARTPNSERSGGCKQDGWRLADELRSATVLLNNFVDTERRVANTLAANAAAATMQPAVDYSGTPDIADEADEVHPVVELTAFAAQDGPAWDVAFGRAKTT